jgi:hypothetical protein
MWCDLLGEKSSARRPFGTDLCGGGGSFIYDPGQVMESFLEAIVDFIANTVAEYFVFWRPSKRRADQLTDAAYDRATEEEEALTHSRRREKDRRAAL